jgi:hypothetical protein
MRNKRWLTGLASALLLTMVVGSPALGNDQDRCTLATLDGLYVFAATGFSIPTPTTSAPKAIIELIRFNGDGTLTVPAVIPGDEACSGTLVFASGTSFNLAFAHHAKTIYMIQTNQGNVFQGTATRLSH